MKTLTDLALEKQAHRFADSIHHAEYTLDGETLQRDILRKNINGKVVEIYVYLDDTVVGTVGDAKLIDSDGDVVSQDVKAFTKSGTKGFYFVFRYRFTEVEVDSIETI